MLWLMEGLCRVNQTHLRQFDEFKKRGLIENGYPTVYGSGLHYETEKGTEIWPDIPSLLMGTMGKGVYPGPWGDCIPVSSLILRDDYTVDALGNVSPGERIMGEGQFTTVTEHAFTGEKPILAFDLNNGSTLRCSPEHRVFTRDGEEKRAEDIRTGDLLRTPNEPFPSFPILNPSALSPEDFAWLLGVYVADGWTDLPRHPRFLISGKDGCKKEEQKRRVQGLMEKIGVHTRWDARYLAVNDRPLAEYMKACGGHAPEKHLPTLCMSQEQVRSLMSGLAADSSVANSGTITHGTTSEILALQLRILYRMLGQSVHIKRWDDHGGLGTHPMYRITVRQPEDPGHPNARRNSARVVAIREEEPEMCCDITTDTGRFYLPESDTIVHNCEDLACYRVAELRELPWHYERIAPWKRKKDDGKPNIEMADPRFPQGDAERAASAAKHDWPGWKRVKGGIPAKPFAKWRRGPQGNYHYHALTLIPDGRLEDPSLVLGMGKEAAFAEAGTAEKLRNAEIPVMIQYAKAPEVMVVDPEKPSGYNGGVAIKLDKDVLALMAKRTDLASGDPEMGAYLSNNILLGDGEFDVDAVIGWSRDERRFIPKNDTAETKRLLGYARH
jgi:intein/homing endonuclease